ncbi:MAG TPA: DUF4288 domain-containing protein [Flavisolibacter sp.]|nr:DUF4288 domain-containing protein [Flavisolibacter sp.]
MKWYLAKIVYRIICGDGQHTAQFDEQLRLVSAGSREEALAKAESIGHKEEEVFYNQHRQLVKWEFVATSELYILNDLLDGAELYSRINEVDDADSYVSFVHGKADLLRNKDIHYLLNLT